MLIGLYVLAKLDTLFKRQIKNKLLRKNIVVWLVSICFILALTATNQEVYAMLSPKKLMQYCLLQIICVTIAAIFVFNVTQLVIKYLSKSNLSFRKRMAITLFTIVICAMLAAFPINYIASNSFLVHIEYRLVLNFYSGCVIGLVYVTMNYVDLDRTRKMNEKELEVSRLQALKTKAELDALHSKINPHFLYNALNSIADLSITDGKKARRMTVALADLFRYSINYSDNNYSSVKDEVEMAAIYLEIEKIRFEDKLNYTIQVDEELNHFLVPRFVLQPIVENAVKHGLKATGKLTEISIIVKKEKDGVALIVYDNGPAFPADLIPGYGVKSVYDKLDLLFPDKYEIHFSNAPTKHVLIFINKLMKNEPGV